MSVEINTDDPIILFEDVHKWFGDFHVPPGRLKITKIIYIP